VTPACNCDAATRCNHDGIFMLPKAAAVAQRRHRAYDRS
jgi:hypothetical protein